MVKMDRWEAVFFLESPVPQEMPAGLGEAPGCDLWCVCSQLLL